MYFWGFRLFFYAQDDCGRWALCVSPLQFLFSVVSLSHKTSQIWTDGSFTCQQTQTWHESGGNFPSVCCRHVPLHHPVQFAAAFKINSIIRKQRFPSDQLSFLICGAAFDHFFPPRDGIFWILPQCFSSINHQCLANSDANSSSSRRLIFWLTAHCAGRRSSSLNHFPRVAGENLHLNESNLKPPSAPFTTCRKRIWLVL